MQDDVKNNEIKQAGNSSEICEKRRKLIKASAAVPLVATLTTGVAQATSSAVQCMDKDNNPQPPITGNEFKEVEDAAVRVPAIKYEKEGETTLFKLDGLYYADDDGSGMSGTPVSEPSDINDYTATTGYVLDIFQPDAELTGAVRLGPWPKVNFNSTNQPLFQTCWTSVLNTAGLNAIKGNIV